MPIFWQRNREADEAAAGVMRPAPLRAVLTVALFAVVAVAFWRHFETRMTEIEAANAFSDETAAWSKVDRQTLAGYARFFREQWGMKLVVRVSASAPLLPELTPTTLFIGVSPALGRAVIQLPSLAAQRLKDEGRRRGRDVRLGLEDELAACVAAPAPSGAPPCVFRALDGLRDALLAP